MRKLKELLIFLLIITIIIIANCNGGNNSGTGVITLPRIGSITFGTRWNTSDSSVSDTGRTFAATTTKIYYQIKFDSVLANWFSIKNVWTWNDTDTVLCSISIIPSETKRICGEFRKYDGGILGFGTYKLSVFYFDTTYQEASYAEGVNQTFTIQ
ncbi:MAG: hypothetical protein ACUVQ4_09755 [bacterium]